MSHPGCYSVDMIHSHRPARCLVPVALVWSHENVTYRATPWPDAQIECNYGGEWISLSPSTAVLAAASRADQKAWRSYLEFTPAVVRQFLGLFRTNRMMALQVAARCPELIGTLLETPALVPFLAAHATLRGEGGPRWSAVNAVFERGGVFGVLDWLGLPGTKQALAILRNLVSPDVAPALVEPLRKTLWVPQGVFALAQSPVITERQLTDACALAA